MSNSTTNTASSDWSRQYRNGWEIEFISPKQYADDKITMLREEMFINPTQEEIDHLYELKTQGDIDRAVHSIMDRHWD